MERKVFFLHEAKEMGDIGTQATQNVFPLFTCKSWLEYMYIVKIAGNINCTVHVSDECRQYFCFFFQVLIGITSAGKPLRGFTPKELLPAECLSSLVGMLSESNVKPSLHNKAMVLLFNLGESLFNYSTVLHLSHFLSYGRLGKIVQKKAAVAGCRVVADCQ